MPDLIPLLTWLVKATAVLAVARGLSIGLRRSAAGTRYLVWLATLGAVMVLPVVSWWAPLAVPVLPAEASVIPAPWLQPSPVATASRSLAPLGMTSDVVLNEVKDPHFSPSPWMIALGVWVVVATILAAWLAASALIVGRIIRRARPLDGDAWNHPLYEVADRLELAEAPRLLASDEIEMPFACGILRPTVVLPSSAESWTDERRRVVLLHELAHVRRRDLLGHTLGRLACVVYWFHPLVWSAARRLRAESERACDDLVLACGARPADYADHLLDIVTSVRRHDAPLAAMPMAHRREFEGRMLAILDPTARRRTPHRVHSLAVVAGLGVFSVTVAAASPVRRASVPEMAMQLPARVDTLERSKPAAGAPLERPMAYPRAQEERQSQALDSIVRDSVPVSTMLARVARTDPSAGVRRAAVWSLHGKTEAAAVLIDRLTDDDDEDVREMAAWSLVGNSSDDAVEALHGALQGDASAEVRETAAWALGNSGRAADLAILQGAMRDQSEDVRVAALWAIGHQRLRTAPGGVLAALRDREPRLRLLAAWVLSNIQDPASIPALRAAFLHETDTDVMQAQFRALAFMDDRSQAVIDRAMASSDTHLRSRAVRVVAGHGVGVWPWPWPWPQPRPQP